jgi:hypothetical protein
VQPPSDEVTFVILPLLLVDMLVELAPDPLLTLEPLPEVTDTPVPLPPTLVWPETWPLPALIDVDMPVGGFSPGLRCTTLQPAVLISLLLALVLLALLLAAEAAAAAPMSARPAIAATRVFMCRSCPKCEVARLARSRATRAVIPPAYF